MRHLPYTTADDVRIRLAFEAGKSAVAELAAEMGVTPKALRRRYQRRGRKVMPRSPLPVARPAWMTPITREQLMARR